MRSIAAIGNLLAGALVAEAQAEREKLSELDRRGRELASLTPAQRHIHEALSKTTRASFDECIAQARKVDPEITLEDIQAAARKFVAPFPAEQKAIDKRMRKSVQRLNRAR